MVTQPLQPVFDALRPMLANCQSGLIVDKDLPADYSLNTPYVEKYRRSLFFGAVQIKKNYVSYYLMPVYIFPDLLEGISPELKRRMQGKSCFNFRKVEPALFSELDYLTQQCYTRFATEKFINGTSQD